MEKSRHSKSFWPHDALEGALNLFFPPRCVACGGAVERAGTLCAACFAALHILGDPACARCGFPFEYDPGAGALCGACLEKEPPYARGWAVLRYDDAVAGFVARLKYADRTDLAPFCGRLMAAHGQRVLEGAEYLVPVPLHWRRMALRRYNQSLLLARCVARHTGIPLLADGMKRTRHTPPQASLTRRERLENVRGAFAVASRRRPQIAGRVVVLVDDVMTTGATLRACARALAQAKAAEVRILTLARRLRDEG
jgi:ComF family protein